MVMVSTFGFGEPDGPEPDGPEPDGPEPEGWEVIVDSVDKVVLFQYPNLEVVTLLEIVLEILLEIVLERVLEIVLEIVLELEDEPVVPPKGAPHVAAISPVLLNVSATALPPDPLVILNMVDVY
jgi:hypothetical protein